MNRPFDRSDDDVNPTDDILAAEYVLGVLDADERAAARERVARDDAFARLVAAWEERFAPWLAAHAEVAPSAHVWPRIRRRLGWESVQGSRASRWDDARFWRTVAGLAAAACIAVVVFGLNRPIVPPPRVTEEPAAQPVTVLARDDGATGWIARIDAAQGEVLMVPVPTPADAAGKVNELWIIPAGGTPQSLGFLSNEKAHTIHVPPALRTALAAGATLAVTLENETGIPHAAPTGAIVAKGSIRAI